MTCANCPGCSGECKASDAIPVTALTLRDHFAACALHGIVSSGGAISSRGDAYASVAYAVADAMLAERAKGGGK